MSDPDIALRVRALTGQLLAAPSKGNPAGHHPLAVPVYPVEVWPAPFRDYLTAAAAAVDAPVDMAAVPLASIVGGVIGNRRPIMMKAGFVVRPSLWTAIVADPTTGKSPMLDHILALVQGTQADAVSEYTYALQAYDASLNGRKRSEISPRPRPVLEHYFTSNCTMEWVAPAARDSAGVAVVRDELLGWFRDLDAYHSGKGGDRQTWLSLWSGGSLKVDRRGSETIFAEHPVVTLTGGIQPGRFPELARDAAADGFLARFLLSIPVADVPGWSEATIPQEIFDAARDLMTQLRMREYQPPLRLSDEARELFREWHNDNSVDVREASPLLRAAFGKFPIQVAKLAGILHACHDPAATVEVLPLERMHGAITLVEYYREHAICAYELLGVATENPLARLERRVDRILRKSETKTIEGWTNRSAILDGLRNVASTDLTEVLEGLLARGIVERQRVRGVTKPPEQWRLASTHTAFGASEYSEYPGSEERNTEYAEYPNGQEGEIPTAAFEEMIV